MSDTSSPVFRPGAARALPQAGYKFQVHHLTIGGDLALHVRTAQLHSQLTAHAFVVECIKFAIAHLSEELPR